MAGGYSSGGLGEVELSQGGVSDQGRGSGCSSSAPARIAPVVRTICYIAAELVRLVGCVESMKPVLQSVYHRILLYPPPQHRVEAIRIMKEVRVTHTHAFPPLRHSLHLSPISHPSGFYSHALFSLITFLIDLPCSSDRKSVV